MKTLYGLALLILVIWVADGTAAESPICGDKHYGGCPDEECLQEFLDIMARPDGPSKANRLRAWTEKCAGKGDDGDEASAEDSEQEVHNPRSGLRGGEQGGGHGERGGQQKGRGGEPDGGHQSGGPGGQGRSGGGRRVPPGGWPTREPRLGGAALHYGSWKLECPNARVSCVQRADGSFRLMECDLPPGDERWGGTLVDSCDNMNCRPLWSAAIDLADRFCVVPYWRWTGRHPFQPHDTDCGAKRFNARFSWRMKRPSLPPSNDLRILSWMPDGRVQIIEPSSAPGALARVRSTHYRSERIPESNRSGPCALELMNLNLQVAITQDPGLFLIGDRSQPNGPNSVRQCMAWRVPPAAPNPPFPDFDLFCIEERCGGAENNRPFEALILPIIDRQFAGPSLATGYARSVHERRRLSAGERSFMDRVRIASGSPPPERRIRLMIPKSQLASGEPQSRLNPTALDVRFSGSTEIDLLVYEDEATRIVRHSGEVVPFPPRNLDVIDRIQLDPRRWDRPVNRALIRLLLAQPNVSLVRRGNDSGACYILGREEPLRCARSNDAWKAAHVVSDELLGSDFSQVYSAGLRDRSPTGLEDNFLREFLRLPSGDPLPQLLATVTSADLSQPKAGLDPGLLASAGSPPAALLVRSAGRLWVYRDDGEHPVRADTADAFNSAILESTNELAKAIASLLLAAPDTRILQQNEGICYTLGADIRCAGSRSSWLAYDPLEDWILGATARHAYAAALDGSRALSEAERSFFARAARVVDHPRSAIVAAFAPSTLARLQPLEGLDASVLGGPFDRESELLVEVSGDLQVYSSGGGQPDLQPLTKTALDTLRISRTPANGHLQMLTALVVARPQALILRSIPGRGACYIVAQENLRCVHEPSWVGWDPIRLFRHGLSGVQMATEYTRVIAADNGWRDSLSSPVLARFFEEALGDRTTYHFLYDVLGDSGAAGSWSLTFTRSNRRPDGWPESCEEQVRLVTQSTVSGETGVRVFVDDCQETFARIYSRDRPRLKRLLIGGALQAVESMNVGEKRLFIDFIGSGGVACAKLWTDGAYDWPVVTESCLERAAAERWLLAPNQQTPAGRVLIEGLLSEVYKPLGWQGNPVGLMQAAALCAD